MSDKIITNDGDENMTLLTTCGRTRRKKSTRAKNGQFLRPDMEKRAGIRTGELRNVITARRQTKEALRQSEARFREMADLLPQPLYEADLDGVITFVNRAAFDHFGYTPEDLSRGFRVTDLLVAVEREQALRNLAGLLRGSPVRSHEYTALRKDGVRFPVIISSAAVLKEGRASGFRGVILDITDRIRGERQVRQSELKFRQLAETISEVFWISDIGTGEILYVSPAYLKIFGRTCQSFYEAGSFCGSVHPDDKDRAAKSLGEAGTPGDFEFRIIRPDDSVRWIRARTFLVMNDLDQATRVVGVAEDITDRKSADDIRRTHTEQLQALSLGVIRARESERQYIARELHDEIGQLATGLKLGLAVLEPGAPPAPDLIARLQTLADELIREIRNLSMGLRPSMLDDFGLLPALEWLCNRFLTQTAVEVSFHHRRPTRRFPPEIETVVYRIVQESLTNVARYAGVDTATVCLEWDDGALRLEISDAGCGFDTACMKQAGEHIGLFGMRERVESVGGRLTIVSAPGAGTGVKVEIPLAVPASEGKEL